MATAGTSAFDGFEGGTDGDAPYLQNRDPAPSSVDQLAASVYLEIVDDDTGVDLSTVLIEINVDGGGWQDVYAASAFVDPYDDGSSQGAASPNGFSFTIVPDAAFGNGEVVEVRVTADDAVNNTLGPVTYQFQTGIPPYVSLRDPGIDETNVPINEPVIVALKDDGSGLDDQETEVYIAGTLAFDADGGGFQATFAGTYVETVVGLEWTVTVNTHPVWTEGQVVSVRAVGADNNGFTLDETENFTARDQPPYVDNRDPAPSTVVGVAQDIYVEVKDLDSGVNLSTVTIDVQINGSGYVPAYNAGFQAPYDGAGSLQDTVTDGYSFNLDRTSDFTAGDAIDVRVNATDLASNAMVEVIYSFAVSDGPTITNLVPADSEPSAPVDTTIAFRVLDDDGVDLTSIDAVLNGILNMVTDGVAGPGYSLQTTPVAGGHDVVITVVSGLTLDTDYDVFVHVIDTLGAESSTTWSFHTDQGLLTSPILNAIAGNAVIRLYWVVPAPELMLQERFELRRSLSSFPLAPEDGDLVYEGTDYEFVDEDVENGRRHYYTLFLLRRLPDEYLDYDERASDSAKPRQVVVGSVVLGEYVPSRGEFGDKTTNPLPKGRIASSWTQNRNSDLITVTSGQAVQSPVRGTIRGLESNAVELQVDSGLVLRFDGFLPLSGLSGIVEAGEVIGRTSASTIEFSIHKLPDETAGKRTVRPLYFYLTIENRDGR